MPLRTTAAITFAALFIVPSSVHAEKPASPALHTPVRIGAVAYAPGTVTVFQGICRFLRERDFDADYVLYSDYDALVAALDRGEVDVAWNTPLAHAQFHVRRGCASQTLVMRDVDCNVRSVLVARADAGIESPADLSGKTLVLGSSDAAEATVLPLYDLSTSGVDLSQVNVLSLDGEFDSKGNPCSSPHHVLKALRQGRGQAGIITAGLWQRVAADSADDGAKLLKIWESPPFSHCVFTAAADFDADLANRFTELMLDMRADDPATADVLRLEGANCWVPGGPEGFDRLVQALLSTAHPQPAN